MESSKPESQEDWTAESLTEILNEAQKDGSIAKLPSRWHTIDLD